MIDAHALSDTVALVTGSAKRLGATTAKALHVSGANVIVHCHQSQKQAQALVDELNAVRGNSAALLVSPLGTREQADKSIQDALSHWNRLDFLINNASTFYPTPVGSIDEAVVSDLFASNVTAPLFMTQAAKTELSRTGGAVVNMVDIHGFQPLENHSVYCAAKAALIMLTKSLALELAPAVRVNGIAPGAILWPENDPSHDEQEQQKIAQIPLGRCGRPKDIAQLIVYLCSDAGKYITGDIIKVDGGRSL